MHDHTHTLSYQRQSTDLPPWIRSLMAREQSEGNKRPLPASIRQRFEAYFGLSLDSTRIVVSEVPGILSANAFAFGDDIHIAPEYADIESSVGVELLCHEIAHSIQVRMGMLQLHSEKVISDPVLEQQADRLAQDFRCFSEQREWTRQQIHSASKQALGFALQCQARGMLDTNYLGAGMHPVVPVAPAGIGFAGANQINEVWSTRALAFARAKALLGNAGGTARRTYHWYTMVVPDNHPHPENEGLGINGRQLLGANAVQRTGRYYDFGRGKLIVEHLNDPHSTTQIGAGGNIQRGHFHIACYDNSDGMYMPYRTVGGVTLAGSGGNPGPAVYQIDRRYEYEQGDIHNGGVLLHHHIYYH